MNTPTSTSESDAVLDELRNMLVKWETHYIEAARKYAVQAAPEAALQMRARADVVRDVLSVIGR